MYFVRHLLCVIKVINDVLFLLFMLYSLHIFGVFNVSVCHLSVCNFLFVSHTPLSSPVEFLKLVCCQTSQAFLGTVYMLTLIFLK